MNELYENICTRIQIVVSKSNWSAKLIKVLCEEPTCIRVMIEYSFSTFSFERELKISNFQSVEQYDLEVEKQLNLLESYTATILQIQNLVTEETNWEDYWKAKLVEVNVINPLECELKFIFGRTNYQFSKIFRLHYYTFVSFENYLQELNMLLNSLNQLDAPPDYESITKQTIYYYG